MSIKQYFHKAVIGRNELVNFPTLGLEKIPAKIDSGAYRSAVHATKIVEKDGELSFVILLGHAQTPETGIEVKTKKYQKVWVANSFGRREERYEVKLRTKLGSKVFNASFSLANRSRNLFPVLIGREILNGRFMIDTNYSPIKRKTLALPKGADVMFDIEEKE